MTDTSDRNNHHATFLAPLWQRLAKNWADRIAVGSLTLVFPDGSRHESRGTEPGPAAELVLHRGRTLWRMLTGGDLGLAEAYMDGDWSTPDLALLLEFGLRNEKALGSTLQSVPLVGAINRLRHRLNANSRAGSKRNITYHYDLGNDFYRRWLDPTMTYSSAVFETPGDTLEAAQKAKYRRIAEAIGLKQGDRVLEIGCGWGGFAEYAAGTVGAHVTGITLSPSQAEFARARLDRAGLKDRTEIALTDYRDTTGRFDKIVSIEMFEAVGEENWATYFDTVRERLVAGGKAGLQIITVADERFAAYRKQVDFIQRYIFPGGMLPSPTALSSAVDAAGLKLKEAFWFGTSYAETLKRWNETFQAEWKASGGLGFDERFRRMWTYYLEGCEACFRLGTTNVGQFVLERR